MPGSNKKNSQQPIIYLDDSLLEPISDPLGELPTSIMQLERFVLLHAVPHTAFLVLAPIELGVLGQMREPEANSDDNCAHESDQWICASWHFAEAQFTCHIDETVEKPGEENSLFTPAITISANQIICYQVSIQVMTTFLPLGEPSTFDNDQVKLTN